MTNKTSTTRRDHFSSHITSLLVTVFFAAILCAAVPCPALGQDETKIDFRRDVQPILADKCFHCHGPDADNQESDFRADSKEDLFADLGGYAAVVPGDLQESALWNRIHSDDEDEVMPPPDSNRSLSDQQKRILDLWIEQGAPYQGHWAFEKVTRPDVPAGAAADGSTNPIDAFITRKLTSENLKQLPRAKPIVLLRRASMTLTGLLPPVELQQRVNDDPTIEVYHSAVDELIDSMAYAERQSLRWLDAGRYADTDGYQNDNERTNWPWRDWVIKAFNDNMPFDQFTIEQLAGDMLDNPTRSQQLASTFNRNHRQNAEGGALAKEFFVENVIDRVETTSTVWMGLTMGCARCHDHKYDPLSQREFYQMFGYFNNIGEKGIGAGRDSNPILKTFSPFKELPKDKLVELEAAEKVVDDAKKTIAKRQKKWESETVAKLEEGTEKASSSLTEDENSDEDSEEATSKKGFDSELIAALKKTGNKRNFKEKKKIRAHYETIDEELVAATSAFKKLEKELVKTAGPRVPVMVMREREGEPRPSFLLARGQYDAPVTSEKLPRKVPKALLAGGQEQPANRLELARWLVSRDNPLTARVTVNRIWRDHFGIGLVKTSEDFGVQGEVPSHPELLDWLAAEFMESGWDVKALHRLIVTSETYCQQTKTNAALHEKDPDNRLLAHGPRYRADGFVIRDIALQAGGLLNEKVGGPPVKPYQPKGLWANLAASKGTKYSPSSGDNLFRKSMYSYWKRAVNPPRQTIFDAGGREVCNVRVRRTNTPLQALVLMNDPTMIEAARNLAQRAILVGGSEAEQIQTAYKLALAKSPNQHTMKVLERNLTFFKEHFSDRKSAAQELMAIGDSKRDASINVKQHAAMTSVAHLILNLDEFITIE